MEDEVRTKLLEAIQGGMEANVTVNGVQFQALITYTPLHEKAMKERHIELSGTGKVTLLV